MLLPKSEEYSNRVQVHYCTKSSATVAAIEKLSKYTKFSLNISKQAEIDSSSLVRLNISASRNTFLPGKLMENIFSVRG